MTFKLLLRLVAIVLVCVMISSCSAIGAFAPATQAPTGTPQQSTVAPTATPSPPSTPSPSPWAVPTTVPTPTPTTAPTATADPWAGFFNAAGPYLSVQNAAKGPWIYKDETLSINIQLKRGGRCNHQYYVAEIYTRQPLFYGGFSHQKINSAPELPYRIARRYDAIFAITADYMPKKTNPKGVMIRDNIVYYEKTKVATLAVMPDGNLKIFDPGTVSAAELQQMGVKNSFAFGPVLIKDGKIQDEVNHHPLKLPNYRAAIGQIEKGHYICITTLGSFTLPDLAGLFQSYKCTIAYNMDGGHSACMIFMGEQLNHQYEGTNAIHQRTLPDLMMLGINAAVPDVKAPVYCNGVDVFPGNKPKPTNGPIG